MLLQIAASMNPLEQLRTAAAALPPGTLVTLPREALLDVLGGRGGRRSGCDRGRRITSGRGGPYGDRPGAAVPAPPEHHQAVARIPAARGLQALRPRMACAARRSCRLPRPAEPRAPAGG